MLEAVGRAVGTLLAIALGAEALLTLRPLRVQLNTRTLAWRCVAPILAVPVLAQVSPAMRLAHRAGDAAVAAVASADLLAVGQITLLRLTLVSLTLRRTLRTFGSELHGQWRAEEGIAPTPSLPSPSPALSSSRGLASGRNSPAATFRAHSAGYKTTAHRLARGNQPGRMEQKRPKNASPPELARRFGMIPQTLNRPHLYSLPRLPQGQRRTQRPSSGRSWDLHDHRGLRSARGRRCQKKWTGR
jgi:hypothetical protein